MQTITTKYLAATNTRGSRIKATQSNDFYSETYKPQSITMSYDYALNADQNHAKAAQLLATKLGWKGTFTGGSIHGGYVFVSDETGAHLRFSSEAA